jgi:hypothetical protein
MYYLQLWCGTVDCKYGVLGGTYRKCTLSFTFTKGGSSRRGTGPASLSASGKDAGCRLLGPSGTWNSSPLRLLTLTTRSTVCLQSQPKRPPGPASWQQVCRRTAPIPSLVLPSRPRPAVNPMLRVSDSDGFFFGPQKSVGSVLSCQTRCLKFPNKK